MNRNNVLRAHCILNTIFLQDSSAGLMAATMIAIVPGYISRSVAGSYDNEGEKFCLKINLVIF